MRNINKLMRFINGKMQKNDLGKTDVKFRKISYCCITSDFCINQFSKVVIGNIEIMYRSDEYVKIMFSNVNSEIKENSTYLKRMDIVNDLVKIITEFTGTEGPICSYYLKESCNKIPSYVLEWNFINPEERIYYLAERQIGSHRKIIDSLILFGNRNVHHYASEELLNLGRDFDSKVHGIYMGSINSFWKCDNLSEIELYEEIRKWLFIKRLTMRFESLENKKEDCYGLDCLKYLTKKFGVEFVALSDVDDFLQSDSFDAWYNYYDNIIYSIFSEKDRKKLKRKIASGEDVTDAILPWKEYLKREKMLKKISE